MALLRSGVRPLLQHQKIECLRFSAAPCDMFFFSDLRSRLLHKRGDKSVPELPDCVGLVLDV